MTQTINHAALGDIRWYKPNDPYYYEVDNLPLKSIRSNSVTIKQKVNEIIDKMYTISEIDAMFDDLLLVEYTTELLDVATTPATQQGEVLVWDGVSQYVPGKLDLGDMTRHNPNNGPVEKDQYEVVVNHTTGEKTFEWTAQMTTRVISAQEMIPPNTNNRLTFPTRISLLAGPVGGPYAVTSGSLSVADMCRTDGLIDMNIPGLVTHMLLRFSGTHSDAAGISGAKPAKFYVAPAAAYGGEGDWLRCQRLFSPVTTHAGLFNFQQAVWVKVYPQTGVNSQRKFHWKVGSDALTGGTWHTDIASMLVSVEAVQVIIPLGTNYGE